MNVSLKMCLFSLGFIGVCGKKQLLVWTKPVVLDGPTQGVFQQSLQHVGTCLRNQMLTSGSLPINQKSNPDYLYRITFCVSMKYLLSSHSVHKAQG